MASPQTENGYTRIANELLEAILIHPFSKREILIVLAVSRKTYGYQKKAGEITNWSLSSMTGIPRNHVATTIQKLHEDNVLTVSDSDTVSHGQPVKIIGINKHYDKWLTVSDSDTVSKPDTVSELGQNRVQTGTPTVSELGHHIKESKENKERKKELLLPDWLNPKTWKDFIDHRKGIKAPMTDQAKTLLIGKLSKLRTQGHDPTELLENAIMSGWKSVYPQKQDKQAIGSKRNERLRRELEAVGNEGAGDDCRNVPKLVYC